MSVQLLPTSNCLVVSKSALRLLSNFLYWQLSLIFHPFPASVPAFSFSFSYFDPAAYPLHHPFPSFSSLLLPVLTSVTHSAPATLQLHFASCLSWAVWAEVSGLGRVGRCISVSACLCNRRRRVSGPLSADQHRCRWEVKSSPVTRARRQWPTAEAGPPSPLSSSVPSEICLLLYCVHLSFTHTLPSLLSFCYCSSEDGVGSDKVLGLIDGQSWRLDERMDEGRGGSLTQANTERQRGTTCSAMQPLTAPQQFSPPLTQCQWTLSLATCLFTVHMNNCDSVQRLEEFSAHKEQ